MTRRSLPDRFSPPKVLVRNFALSDDHSVLSVRNFGLSDDHSVLSVRNFGR